ncbi:MAG: S8 family serine peptidase, partial [Clostridiales bacterium]|nr:S8 family serine peptidase [Clostridiales bacterium]
MKKKLLSVSIIFFMLSALFALHCAGSFSRGILRAGQAGAFSDALYDMLEIYGEKSPSSDDSPYATKRIFVKTSESLNPRGAVMTARFGDVFVLQYATETAASAALEYYLSLTKTEFAEIDSLIKIAQSPEYLDSESLLSEDGDLNVILEDIDEGETVAQAEGENYLSWGAAHIGVDIYTDYLSQVVGANNLNEVVVAVIDTGIDATHPLFDGRIASGGKNFSSSSPIGYEYRDENGHGTHVGGIISDLTPQNVKILPLKVINAEGVAAFSAIIASVYYAAELKLGGVNIVAANFSLSGAISTGSTSGSLYKAALENLRALNILPVSAAGNDNRDALSYAPGNVESSITVSSVEYAGGKFSKAQSSNYGSSVDLCAPGVSIRSAKVGGGYVYMSGTSMAAPHVSAVIALLLSNPANENMSAKQ